MYFYVRNEDLDSRTDSFKERKDDVNPTIDPVIVRKGGFTRSKVKNIQEAFALYL